MNRVVFNKPYRWLHAFDGMSDDDCKRWMRRAGVIFRWRIFVVDIVFCILAVPGLFVVMWIAYQLSDLVCGLLLPAQWANDAAAITSIVLSLAALIVIFELVRDLTMRGCLKRMLRGVLCPCGYSPAGLPAEFVDGRAQVRCPECGETVEIDGKNLPTPASPQNQVQ